MSSDMNVRMVFQAIDRATKPLQKIAGAAERLAGRSGLQKVTRAAERVSKATGGMVRQLQRFAKIGTVAAGALGAAMFGLAKTFANAGDNAAKAARKVGVGVEWLQRHQYAANLAGVQSDTFATALQRFARRASAAAAGGGEAVGSLRALGVQLTDADGKMRPTEDLFYDVAEAMSKVEDKALRVRMMFSLFDSEGVALVNMLDKGAGAMAKLAAEADELGKVISEKDALAAEEFNDSLSRLTGSIEGIRNAIGAQLLPVLQPIIDRMREWAVANREMISARVKEAIDRIVAALPLLIEQGKAAARVFGTIARAIWDFFEPIGGAKTMLIALAGVLSAKLIVSILATGSALAQFGIILATTPIGWFLGAAAALAAAAYLIYRNWDVIGPFFERLWETVTDAFAKADAFISEVLNRIDLGALSLKATFLDVVGVIVAAINDLVGSLPSFVTTRLGLDGIGDFERKIAAVRRETEAQRQSIRADIRQDAIANPSTVSGPGRTAEPGNAHLVVDFNNLPSGSRVRKERSKGLDIDLNAGYSMVGS